jgi:hypothetical protein
MPYPQYSLYETMCPPRYSMNVGAKQMELMWHSFFLLFLLEAMIMICLMTNSVSYDCINRSGLFELSINEWIHSRQLTPPRMSTGNRLGEILKVLLLVYNTVETNFCHAVIDIRSLSLYSNWLFLLIVDALKCELQKCQQLKWLIYKSKVWVWESRLWWGGFLIWGSALLHTRRCHALCWRM